MRRLHSVLQGTGQAVTYRSFTGRDVRGSNGTFRYRVPDSSSHEGKFGLYIFAGERMFNMASKTDRMSPVRLSSTHEEQDREATLTAHIVSRSLIGQKDVN